MKERESLASMKFDVRLRRRQGWVSDDDVEAHVEALPDVSNRIQVEEEGSEPAAAEEAPSSVTPSGEPG